MCGIVGICALGAARPADEAVLREMLGTIRHRGPDEYGIYLDDGAALGHARLSIIDLDTGQQPIPNEDGSLWIVFNGEVFNHPELRVELERRGHRFSTRSDSEVVLHAYEEYGEDCVSRFNGQFAVAIWNSRERTLFLARDRLGVRPLFYTVADGALVFGSEIKAILAAPGVSAVPDPVALDQIFTYWSTLSPRTFFSGIEELPPAITCSSRMAGSPCGATGSWPSPRRAPSAGGPRRSTRRSSETFSSTPRAYGFAPTSRSAPT